MIEDAVESILNLFSKTKTNSELIQLAKKTKFESFLKI